MPAPRPDMDSTGATRRSPPPHPRLYTQSDFLPPRQILVIPPRFRRTCKLQRELRETRTTLDNRIVIEKAKGLLMISRGLTEDEAMTPSRSLGQMS